MRWGFLLPAFAAGANCCCDVGFEPRILVGSLWHQCLHALSPCALGQWWACPLTEDLGFSCGCHWPLRPFKWACSDPLLHSGKAKAALDGPHFKLTGPYLWHQGLGEEGVRSKRFVALESLCKVSPPLLGEGSGRRRRDGVASTHLVVVVVPLQCCMPLGQSPPAAQRGTGAVWGFWRMSLCFLAFSAQPESMEALFVSDESWSPAEKGASSEDAPGPGHVWEGLLSPPSFCGFPLGFC